MGQIVGALHSVIISCVNTQFELVRGSLEVLKLYIHWIDIGTPAIPVLICSILLDLWLRFAALVVNDRFIPVFYQLLRHPRLELRVCAL